MLIINPRCSSWTDGDGRYTETGNTRYRSGVSVQWWCTWSDDLQRWSGHCGQTSAADIEDFNRYGDMLML